MLAPLLALGAATAAAWHVQLHRNHRRPILVPLPLPHRYTTRSRHPQHRRIDGWEERGLPPLPSIRANDVHDGKDANATRTD